MRDKRTVDELTIEELEMILAIKKREARQARLRSLSQRGRVVGASPEDDCQPMPEPQLHELVANVPAPDHPRTYDTTFEAPQWEDDEATSPREPTPKALPKTEPVRPLAERRAIARKRQRRDRFLLRIEVAALVAFVVLLGSMVIYVQGVIARTNEDLAVADAPTPTPTAEIDLAIVLPGGHTPPNPSGGVSFNWQEIPEHLRPVVQARLEAPVTVPTPSSTSPVRVRIPAINVDHQVVMGDDEDALRRGIGYHIGSANPGMRGNMVLSAHNDAFGQIFRYLDRLNPGDEIFVHTMSQEFLYTVSDSQVVGPLDTWVMQSTQTPTLTLISCYPYMIDTQRIVVFADLVE